MKIGVMNNHRQNGYIDAHWKQAAAADYARMMNSLSATVWKELWSTFHFETRVADPAVWKNGFKNEGIGVRINNGVM